MIIKCVQRLTQVLAGIVFIAALCCASRTEAADEEPVPASPTQQQSPVADADSPGATGEVLQRGFDPKFLQTPGGGFSGPSLSGPAPATKVPVPGITAPPGGTTLPPDRYQAPTANLTIVANAVRLMHKSLTTLVTVPPNLPVTKPVEISIGYYSPAGNQRITQSYVRSSGSRFLYNDKEGDGKPRTMRLDITLSEPKVGGGGETFNLPWQANLDPLYDVTIGPFAFDLISKCDAVGASEIIFGWYSPDRQYRKFKFSTRAGSRTTINPFAWARSEVSWSHQLFREQSEFYDEDNAATDLLWNCLPLNCNFSGGGGTYQNQNHLLTSRTQLVKGNLKARNDNCEAYFEYQMTKTLRGYSSLDGK